ncbi:DUF2497 domain-containing protein [Novosphingobium sp. TH158]|uniref:DUF2497 domain-containing protein n=1 Tax=Novosphingobium sp. TH158 TaxID=2067455 RepID=UPI000C7CF075|nr:DUF2497 domain-containing protein [Novosphingobium sp. TH158]PLK27230.1 DUF2497 domain-containing protein [Novosphingobium sp. TH158]
MAPAGEPSVEDILASIKKVIARDVRLAEEAPRRAQNQAVSGDDDGILDLSEEAELVEETPLVTEQARVTMRESLAALSVMAQPGVAPQIVRSGETSLEGMVRDLLRPALAEWLDKNLPPLVEQMVAAEIARIVGKKL